MGTCAVIAQGAATAAVLCHERICDPTDLQHQDGAFAEIQRRFLRMGQHIPGVVLAEDDDLARQATIDASSSLALQSLPDNGPRWPMKRALPQVLPGLPGPIPSFSCVVDVPEATTLRIELRCSVDRADEHSPHRLLQDWNIDLEAGDNQTIGPFEPTVHLEDERYLFWCIVPPAGHAGDDTREPVQVHTSKQFSTVLISLVYNTTMKQDNFGGEDLMYWIPMRRPQGHNIAFSLGAPVTAMQAERIQSGSARPSGGPEAWVADPNDPAPQLSLRWPEPRRIARVEFAFDVDYDNAMESAQWEHNERVMPFVVCDFSLHDATGKELKRITNNHHGQVVIDLPEKISSDCLTVKIHRTGGAPAAIHRVRVYAK